MTNLTVDEVARAIYQGTLGEAMSVNLYIDCEGWDEFANGGMKEILRNNDKFPKIYAPRKHWDDDDCDFRPADFEAWRIAIVALNCNVEMWLKGLAELEAFPSKTISASY